MYCNSQYNKGLGTKANQPVSVYLDKFSEQSLKRMLEAIVTSVLLLQAIEGILQASLCLFSLVEQRQVREKSYRKSLKGNNLYIQIVFIRILSLSQNVSTNAKELYAVYLLPE